MMNSPPLKSQYLKRVADVLFLTREDFLQVFAHADITRGVEGFPMFYNPCSSEKRGSKF